MPNAQQAHQLLGRIRSASDELHQALEATKGGDWADTPIADFTTQGVIDATAGVRDKAQNWREILRTRLGAVDISDLT